MREWSGQPRNRCPEEHDELRWVTAAELPGLELADSRYVELLTELLTDHTTRDDRRSSSARGPAGAAGS